MVIKKQMLKEKKRLLLHVFVLFFALFSFSSLVYAAEVSLVLVAPTSSSPQYRVSVKIDQADKLAGLKIIITHDKKQFEFVKSQKSAATNSFMHIANDKKDGQVVVVMASAKGVSGKDVNLLDLEYKSAQQDAGGSPPVLKITQCELMSEDLKEIPCSYYKI